MSINDAMIAWEERSIGNCVRSMGWLHQKDGMNTNQKQLPKTSKLLWDFSIQTDHVIQARRADVILIDKGKKECKIIDFAIPYDGRVNATEMEKMCKIYSLANQTNTKYFILYVSI